MVTSEPQHKVVKLFKNASAELNIIGVWCKNRDNGLQNDIYKAIFSTNRSLIHIDQSTNYSHLSKPLDLLIILCDDSYQVMRFFSN